MKIALQESQAAMEESRSLRTKLRLAEQSQEAARKMEQDYEQVVAMLENEISHLRLQMSKSVSDMRPLLAFVFTSVLKVPFCRSPFLDTSPCSTHMHSLSQGLPTNPAILLHKHAVVQM